MKRKVEEMQQKKSKDKLEGLSGPPGLQGTASCSGIPMFSSPQFREPLDGGEFERHFLVVTWKASIPSCWSEVDVRALTKSHIECSGKSRH